MIATNTLVCRGGDSARVQVAKKAPKKVSKLTNLASNRLRRQGSIDNVEASDEMAGADADDSLLPSVKPEVAKKAPRKASPPASSPLEVKTETKGMKKAGGKEGATGARRQSQMLDDYRSATP